MALFNINKLSSQPTKKSPQDFSLGQKHLAQHMAKVEAIKNLNGRLPAQSEIFYLFTENSFNAFTFIPYFIKQHGQIQELIISTYSINQRILQALNKLLQKQELLRVHILISDSIKFRVPKVADQLQHLAQQYPSFSVNFAWNHSKITLIQTAQGHYCAEGSGNFSENSANEQYIIVNSEEVYNFRKNCIMQVQPITQQNQAPPANKKPPGK